MKKRMSVKIAGTVIAGAVLALGFGFLLYAQTGGEPEAGKKEKILTGLVYQLQRKDTKLLCLDECASDLDPSEKVIGMRWDSEQPGLSMLEHGIGNCARASISMMVSYYGKHLSQDRIAYYMEEERPGAGDQSPEGDLAHQKGTKYSPLDGGEETLAIQWALNESVVFKHVNPTFSQLKGWLDDNRPIMIRRINYAGLGILHVCVVDGYRVTYDNGSKKEEIHILDPMVKPEKDFNMGWRQYPIPIAVGPTRQEIIEGIWVGPVSAPNARADETSIWIDSDRDGIMDFDERKRFHTDPLRKDTDYDGVDDKNDIREYVFNAQHKYAKRVADFDNDGVRKELDPDNDGDLVMDGCEDSNQNGKYEPARGESNNFDPQIRLAACLGDPDFNISTIDKSGMMVYPVSAPGKIKTEAASSP
jgi:hypothetical protein